MSDKIFCDNRYEGRIGARRGIFPATYVDVSVEPGETRNTLGLFIFILETIKMNKLSSNEIQLMIAQTIPLFRF